MLIWAMILLPLLFSPPLHSGWLEAVPSDEAAPQWVLKDLKGKEYGSHDLRGKTVLINFWASWCPPCIEEMPSLVRLHKRMDRQGLVVLAINVEEHLRHVGNIARRMNLTFPVLLDSNRRVADAWQVRVYPSSFLIDSQGRLRYRAVGPVAWDSDEVISVVGKVIQMASQ